MTTQREVFDIEVEVNIDIEVNGTDVASVVAQGVAALNDKQEGEHEIGGGDVNVTSTANELRLPAPTPTKDIAGTAHVTEHIPDEEESECIKWFMVYEIIIEIIEKVVPSSTESSEQTQNIVAERVEVPVEQPEPVIQPEQIIENAQNNIADADADEINDDAFIDDNVDINIDLNFQGPQLEPIEEEDEAEVDGVGDGEGEAEDEYNADSLRDQAVDYCQCTTAEKCRHNFNCNICHKGVRNAVITICGHLFCWPCLWQYVRLQMPKTSCPHCARHLRMHEDVVPYYGGNDDDDDLIMATIPNMVPRPSAFRFKTGASYNCWFFVDEAYRRAMHNYPRRRLEHVVNRLESNEHAARWCSRLRNIEIGIIILILLLSFGFRLE